uniref:Cell adhesion molecule L1-like b n=1 Tax=Esox lucius TaxID=8010 RepID=A0A6Q2WUQ0_ESOLU
MKLLHLHVYLPLMCHICNVYFQPSEEQPPTITVQTHGPVIALPSDNSFSMRCEAKGNPQPVYRWTKDGQELDPLLNLGIKKERNNGSFEFRSSALAQFQGKYQCYASNKLGTAVSEEIKLIVSNVPKFPKEKIDPIVVEEGQPIILECNPPQGISPRQIYWMSINLQHIEQDERVSMGMDGNLYFSNALLKDSRSDYCCFAYFSAIRTIVQKTAMSVVVKSSYTIQQRIPRLLTPPGVQSEVLLVKGEELVLECISEGFPTSVMNWKKMGEELPKRAEIKNYGKLLTISKVEEKDNGKYRCKANNSIGDAIHDFIVTVEDPPRWQPEPPRGQLAVIGSEVNIKCSASGKPKPVISWRRNGQPLDDGSLERQVFDDTLVLHRARPEDSAVYQCEASNRHGTILANVNVMIMSHPPRILTKDNQRYLVVRGRKVVMDCKVFSSPPSDVSWKKHGTVESVKGERFSFLKNGSLLINQTEKEDSGEYVCSATSSDKTTSIKASLDVKDATKIVEQPQDQQIIRGTTAQLPCQAEYDTSLRKDFEIVWSKDENEITAFTEQYSLVNGTLQIIDVNRSDEGAYTCIARTNLDQDSASARVTVLDVPDAPEYLELSEEKSRSVRLAWVPGDAHNSSVTEFIVEYEENQWNPGTWRELQRVPGNQNTVKLALQGNLNYQFRMCAVNAIGKGPPSRPTDRYKTPPAAPDKNPENIKIEGHLPHQLDISWEPLLPMEHNGPGLEFKVSYRRVGLEYNWTDHLVRRPSIVVKNTPTFVPYEIKIQSRNSHGWGPEPKVVTGYSGEDCESSTPPFSESAGPGLPQATVRGHLGGYNVHWVRKRSLLHSNRISEESQSLTFPGNRSHAIVSDLKPFSEYRTDCERSSNKKGNGPSSDAVIFQTPEGVPEEVPILTASNAQTDSITLVWGPPFEANGILTGYRLQYQPVSETLEVGNKQEVNISGADTTQWLVQGLEDIGGYMFYLSACTKEGCGPPRVEEGHTITEASEAAIQPWIIGMMCAVALLTVAVLMACFVFHNQSGKYAVKEREDLHPEVESQSMSDDTSEISDEKPLKSHSLDWEDGTNSDSVDSLVDYGDEEESFNEDGSFIGEYSSHKKPVSLAESNGQLTA